MPTHIKHSNKESLYFCTFTCFNWINLFEKTDGYDMVYRWFHLIKVKNHCEVVAFVIMPNHLHVLLHFNDDQFNLNKIIANGKRFMAYEIIKILKEKRKKRMLKYLADAVSDKEREKGQKHKVFKTSFDAKAIFTERFLFQKLNYIHNNPVSGKWRLVKDFTNYKHSSASFYEKNNIGLYEPKHFRTLRVSGDPEETKTCKLM